MEIAELWSYEEIEILRPEKLYLVKHKKTGKLAIKKYVRKESLPIYEALSKVRHKNLPQIFGIFSLGEQGVILREYIEGKSLQMSITEGKRFDKKELKEIVCQICEALNVLHSHKPAMIHRDVKPSNIILEKNGTIKLLDFDAARFYDESQDRDTELIGTYGYAAPEQYGFMQTDGRTDIYAVGVLLEKIKGNLRCYDSIIAKCKNMNPKHRYANVVKLKNSMKRAPYKKVCTLSGLVVVLAAMVVGMTFGVFHPPVKIEDYSSLIGTWSWANEDTTTEITISADEQSGEPIIESLWTVENYGSHRSASLTDYSIIKIEKDRITFSFEDSHLNTGTMTARYDLNYDCLYLSSDSGGDLGSTVGRMPFYKGEAVITWEWE